MIARLWHGWTTPANADAYEALIRDTIFPGIVARRIPGLEALDLYRRPDADEVAFVTLMRFRDMEAVRAFAGADAEASVVPPAARALLSRFDDRATLLEHRVAAAT